MLRATRCASGRILPRPNERLRDAGALTPVKARIALMLELLGAEMFDALQSHPWAYPALEVVHIVGIALLLGNLVALEMRVFGRAATLPVAPLARLSLSIALAASRWRRPAGC